MDEIEVPTRTIRRTPEAVIAEYLERGKTLHYIHCIAVSREDKALLLALQEKMGTPATVNTRRKYRTDKKG